MFIENSGLIKEIFIAVNRSNVIISIFVFIEDSTTDLAQALNKAFGNPKLAANSSINGRETTSKIFWRKNSISVFLSKAKDSTDSKIILSGAGVEDKSPGINIEY